MKILFNYRPNGFILKTNNGDFKLMLIRKSVRGIISLIRGVGPIIIWDRNVADLHENDTEDELKQRTIDILNGI